MKKYDLHVHTHYSKCSANKLDKILKQAKKKGLNGIAITDHNTIKGALELKKLNNDKDFEVIIGEEVNTDLCHLLVYFVKKEIKTGTFEKVIKQARKQGAICSIAHPLNHPHPFKRITKAVASLLRLTSNKHNLNPNKKTLIRIKQANAIEGFNARNLAETENTTAQAIAKKLRLGLTAGSDAHFLSEIGNGYVEIDKNLNVKQAIKKRKTKIGGKRTHIIPSKIKILFHILFK